jgi:hypothetical protein
VQIFFILVPKAIIRREICRKIGWFPVDFCFKGLKPKDLKLQGKFTTKKDTRTKTKKHELTRTKIIFKL